MTKGKKREIIFYISWTFQVRPMSFGIDSGNTKKGHFYIGASENSYGDFLKT